MRLAFVFVCLSFCRGVCAYRINLDVSFDGEGLSWLIDFQADGEEWKKRRGWGLQSGACFVSLRVAGFKTSFECLQSAYQKILKHEQALALHRIMPRVESCLRPPAMPNQLENAGCRSSHPIEAWRQGIEYWGCRRPRAADPISLIGRLLNEFAHTASTSHLAHVWTSTLLFYQYVSYISSAGAHKLPAPSPLRNPSVHRPYLFSSHIPSPHDGSFEHRNRWRCSCHFAFKAGIGLYSCIDSIKTADSTLLQLKSEVDALVAGLNSIATTFKARML